MSPVTGQGVTPLIPVRQRPGASQPHLASETILQPQRRQRRWCHQGDAKRIHPRKQEGHVGISVFPCSGLCPVRTELRRKAEVEGDTAIQEQVVAKPKL